MAASSSTIDAAAVGSRRARASCRGQSVSLRRDFCTAGLPTHVRILDALERGEPLPFDLKGGALFHLGSYNVEDANGECASST